MGLAASILLYTTTSTWAYFQQSELAGGVLKTSNARTEFFGNLEIWVNSITLLIQIFLTGRLLKWFGVAFTLVSLPFVSLVGFAAMGVAASLALLAVFQVARRAAAYALMRPSREILFTVLKREDKYNVKSVNDTLGYHRARMFHDMGQIPEHLYESFQRRSQERVRELLVSGEYVGWLVSPASTPDKIVAGAGVQLRTVLPHPATDKAFAEGSQALIINVCTEPEW